MTDIIDAICKATGHVADPYFRLPVAGNSKLVLRERVYCYELYHHIRAEAPQLDPLVITAEPDKRGHPAFAIPRNPDFIFHVPGDPSRNDTVVEVQCRPTRKHLAKDLNTFTAFSASGYSHFVLLLFGVQRIPWERLEDAAGSVPFDLDRVVVLLHARSGQAARRCERPVRPSRL